MKRVVLCGSKRFKDEILQLGEELKNRGYDAVVPREFIVDMKKKDASLLHFKEISDERTDAVLVVNEKKKDLDNYIGANSFAEVAMGFFKGKKVYLKNDIYLPYEEELLGWDVIPLKGNIDEVFKKIEK